MIAGATAARPPRPLPPPRAAPPPPAPAARSEACAAEPRRPPAALHPAPLAADKLTFIILDKALPAPPGGDPPAVAQMCGDVNIFLNDPDAADAAEVEVMVANPGCRGRGVGREALTLLMRYAASRLGVRLFRAKARGKKGACVRVRGPGARGGAGAKGGQPARRPADWGGQRGQPPALYRPGFRRGAAPPTAAPAAWGPRCPFAAE